MWLILVIRQTVRIDQCDFLANRALLDWNQTKRMCTLLQMTEIVLQQDHSMIQGWAHVMTTKYHSRRCIVYCIICMNMAGWNRIPRNYPDRKVLGANMGPTWALSAPDGPHVGPMNLAIRVNLYAGKTNDVDCPLIDWIHIVIGQVASSWLNLHGGRTVCLPTI